MFCTSVYFFTKAAWGGHHLNHLALELVLLMWKQWPLTLALTSPSGTSSRSSSFLVSYLKGVLPTWRFLEGKTCTLHLWTVNLQLHVCCLYSCNTNQFVQKLLPACPPFLKSHATRSIKDWWTIPVPCFCVQLKSNWIHPLPTILSALIWRL